MAKASGAQEVLRDARSQMRPTGIAQIRLVVTLECRTGFTRASMLVCSDTTFPALAVGAIGWLAQVLAANRNGILAIEAVHFDVGAWRCLDTTRLWRW